MQEKKKIWLIGHELNDSSAEDALGGKEWSPYGQQLLVIAQYFGR